MTTAVETITDHLGNQIAVGSFVFWPTARDNSVSMRYGKVVKITRGKSGNLSVTSVRPRKKYNHALGEMVEAMISKTCHRTDLLTAIDPKTAMKIIEGNKNYYG